jgi:hypothetical protein
MQPHVRWNGLVSMLAALTVALLAAPLAADEPGSFDPQPWLEDLDQAREAIGEKYANLEWLVFEREVDISGLFADTRRRVESAGNAAAARAAFDRLARKFGDGHVLFRWPGDQDSNTARTADCAALGYNERMQGSPTAALLPGYSALDASAGDEFPAGIVHSGRLKIGVLKIGVFTPQGYPDLCVAARTALDLDPSSPCDEACSHKIDAWASNRLSLDLTSQLRKLKAAGAEILLVDLIDNGGGTGWAEAAARMVTGVRLKSERIAFVRGSHWAKAFDKTESELQDAVQNASGEDRSLLTRLADEVANRRRDAGVACDSAPLWRGERLSCSWLALGFYSTGLLDSADEGRLREKPWASIVFTPMEYSYHEAIWQGPLIVLVNGATGSAAEQFAAELQDNHAAIVMGAPTAGAGCGHTEGGTPTTLTHSGAVLELPDCARLRSDGSNEVMGIQPDVLVGLRSEDGPHRRALRIAQKLPEAAKRALSLAP